MTEFTCTKCGAQFHFDWSGRGPHPRYCPTCRREIKRAKNRRQNARLRALLAAREEDAKKRLPVIKRCRRCGKEFTEKPIPSYRVPTNSALYSHRYCPSCTWDLRRAEKACDPRYSGIGGHGVIVEARR